MASRLMPAMVEAADAFCLTKDASRHAPDRLAAALMLEPLVAILQEIEDGNAAGLHVYSILYNYRETRESEGIGLKVKRKEYWVRSADCFASSKSTSRNLQAVFGG